MVSSSLLQIAVVAVLSALVTADYCGTVTQWLDKTIYKPVPVYSGG